MVNNKIKILLVLCIPVIIILWFYYSNNNNQVVSKSVTNEQSKDIDIDLNVNEKQDLKQTDNLQSKQTELAGRVSEEALALTDILKTPNQAEVKSDWSRFYGCSNYKERQNREVCTDGIYAADNLDEALWMARQGYPTRDMLTLLDYEENESLLKELAEENNTAAQGLLAIKYQKEKKVKDAAYWAASFKVGSPPNLSFPYRLSGMASMNNLPDPVALADIYIAGILGDTRVNELGDMHPNTRPMMPRMAMELAYQRLIEQFGSYDLIPRDPKP